MSKFIMLTITGISRNYPIIIKADDIISVQSVRTVDHKEHTEIVTSNATWYVKESVEEIFVKLEEK